MKLSQKITSCNVKGSEEKISSILSKKWMWLFWAETILHLSFGENLFSSLCVILHKIQLTDK